MTYSLHLSSRYNRRGRPRKVDYKTLRDRHIEHIPTLMLAGLSVFCSMALYFNRPQPLTAPLTKEQLQEMMSMSAHAQEVTPTPEPDPAPGWDGFVTAAHKVSKIYNFPANVVIAQGALESTRGNSRYAKERNNYLGINAVDSNPDLAYTFENSEQCVVEYMRIIRKNFPQAWASRENPEQLLKYLKVNDKGNYYASDPEYVSKVMRMREWNINK